jgi:hypothetical protein
VSVYFLDSLNWPAFSVFFHRPQLRPSGSGYSGDIDSYAVAREVEDLKAVIDDVGGSALLRQAVQEVADILPNGELLMLKGQSHNVSMKILAPVLTEYFTR